MKKKHWLLQGFSLIALMISLGVFQPNPKCRAKSAKEWVMMAVEEEYYQLDNGVYY